MKTLYLGLVLLVLLPLVYIQQINRAHEENKEVLAVQKGESKKAYWFKLQRKSNKEILYLGEPGNENNSAVVRVFNVKTGIPGQRPTPLPKLAGKEYWEIISKFEVFDNPETAPYFLTLNIPVTEDSPFGPVPYLECGGQCNWELPGAFGLHGNNGDAEKLAEGNEGSSGCIRHSVEDITYLYNLIDFENGGIRYYIDDV